MPTSLLDKKLGGVLHCVRFLYGYNLDLHCIFGVSPQMTAHV